MRHLKISTILTLSFLIVFPGVIFSLEVDVGNAKFVLPLVEKWISEYKKENPESQISIKTGQGDNAEGLFVVAGEVRETDNDRIVYLGKYALIPVSNSDNPLLSKAGKGLRKRDLAKLLFEKRIEDEGFFDDDGTDKYAVTVYSCKGNVASSVSLAKAYGGSPDRIKGKKIIGDEIYLVHAVQTDKNGITFNTMNYVYDIESRKLKLNLSVLPLNNAKYRNAIESQNMDQVISLLEETKIEEIPVDNFGLRISEELVKNDAEAQKFVNWLLARSSEFNHQYGFLNLDEKYLALQKASLNGYIQ
jgi:ABC-type phosphate transport system substrate-binding protein